MVSRRPRLLTVTNFAQGSEVPWGRGVNDSVSSTEVKVFGNDRCVLRKLRLGVWRHEGMMSSETRFD